MNCSDCGYEIHRDSGTAYRGTHVAHLHRGDCIRALRSEIDRLRAENAELREDKARMDWVDSQNYNGCTEIYLGGPWRYYAETNQTIGRWKIEGRPSDRFETARQAIDAAMSQAGTEEGE